MFKSGRNAPCPCGSGLKYKKCCMGKREPNPEKLQAEYAKKYRIRIKQAADIEGIRQAGRLAIDTLDMVESEIRPGLMTEEINTLVHEFTIKHGAICAPLNYR